MRTSVKKILGPATLKEAEEANPGNWHKGDILIYRRKKLVGYISMGKLYDAHGNYFDEQCA